jgi:hypothetical protein
VVFAKIAAGKHCALMYNMCSGMETHVSISLSLDRLLILDGFIVAKRGGKVHHGSNHTMKVAHHVVYMWHCHM